MGKKRKGENKICKACEKQFYVPEYRVETAKFCSLVCQNHKQYERPVFTCYQCKEKFSDSPSRKGSRKFCSSNCYNESQVKKGVAASYKRKFNRQRHREKGHTPSSSSQIRKFAFDFKEKKCECCSYDEYECCLDVHHKDENPNNNDIDNLKILCVMCHRKVHRRIICL